MRYWRKLKRKNNTVEVYELREKVVCFGKLIKHGGFSGRYKTKLFKKCEDRFSGFRSSWIGVMK